MNVVKTSFWHFDAVSRGIHLITHPKDEPTHWYIHTIQAVNSRLCRAFKTLLQAHNTNTTNTATSPAKPIPPTGEFDYLAENIEDWAQAIIEDYNALTGYPLAHEWQQKNGSIPSNNRPLPKTPFVAGGEFTIENLYLVSAVEGTQFRASLANQIKNLPDGAKIKFNAID